MLMFKVFNWTWSDLSSHVKITTRLWSLIWVTDSLVNITHTRKSFIYSERRVLACFSPPYHSMFISCTDAVIDSLWWGYNNDNHQHAIISLITVSSSPPSRNPMLSPRLRRGEIFILLWWKVNIEIFTQRYLHKGGAVPFSCSVHKYIIETGRRPKDS